MYQVAIPSHNRPAEVVTKTLATLIKGRVPIERIRVFVAPEQIDRYAEESGIPIGALTESRATLSANRNFIMGFYPEGTNVVMMDDDVQAIMRKVSDVETEPVENVHALFEDLFEETEIRGLGMWGVYPVLNPMFMRFEYTTDLRFCIGQVFGVRVTGQDVDRVVLNQKDDYERTLKQWRHYGGVLRANGIAAKSPLYGKGGLQSEEFDRATMNRREVRYLMENFPDNVRVAKRRSKVGLEVRLVDKGNT